MGGSLWSRGARLCLPIVCGAVHGLVCVLSVIPPHSAVILEAHVCGLASPYKERSPGTKSSFSSRYCVDCHSIKVVKWIDLNLHEGV